MAAAADTSGDEPVELTFSELAAYLDCGLAYRLRNLLGFQPPLAPELGYGKAVHHVHARRRRAHRSGADTRRAPASSTGSSTTSFFLPDREQGGAPGDEGGRPAARRHLHRAHPDDLLRVWETERPFELHLPTPSSAAAPT